MAQFEKPGYVFSENAGAVTLNIVLDQPYEGSSPLSVFFDESDGTAKLGTDYLMPSNKWVRFNKGEQLKPITIWIKNDDNNIPDKYFYLNLSWSCPEIQYGDNRQVTVTITDNTPTIQFEMPDYAIVENAGSVKLNVTLSHTTYTDVVFFYNTIEGTAKDGINYDGTTNRTGVIPTGKTTATIELPIIDNSAYSGDLTFQVLLNGASRHGIISVPNPATVTIQDKEAKPVVQFNRSEYAVSEDASIVTLNVTMSDTASGPVTVDYTMIDGTATYGEDYSPNTGSVTIPAGEQYKTFTVNVMNDGKYNAPDEYFTVRLTGVSGLASIGSPSEAKVTLTEAGDKPAAQFKEVSYSADENDGNAVLDVMLSGKAGAPVVVHYRTHNGTALSGVNYTGTTDGTITFPADSTAVQHITVPILDDSIYGGNTQFSVELFSASDNAVIGPSDTTTVTIIEDDTPKVFFKQSGYTAGEDDGTVTLDVSLNYPLDSDVVVHYRTIGLTAANNTNFAGTSDGTVTFPAGSTADRPIEIDIIKDDKYNGDPQFKVELYSVTSGNAIVGTPGVATVTIDEELPDVQFAQASYKVGEAAGSVVLEIRLSEPSTLATTVKYSTADGSAYEDSDFTKAFNSEVTISAGQPGGMIVVPIINDLDHEDNETFGVGVTSLAINGASKGVTDVFAEVTIVDNDPLVRLSQSSYTAKEGDGKVTLDLLLDYATDHAITVHYTIMTTTSAVMPDDFTDPNSGVVVIPAGQATRSFDLNIVDDDEIEGTEGFGVMLAGITVNGIDRSDRFSSPDSASVYIQDNDILPHVQFKQAAYTISEDDGGVTLDVTLSGVAGGPVVVQYQTIDGTAKSGFNYTGTNSGTVTFPEGSTADRKIIIPIIDDEYYGTGTQFTVRLNAVSSGNAEIGSPDTAIVTIAEDDPYIVYVHNQWSLVSWPVINNTMKASDITDNETLGVTIVAIYDPVEQTYKSYTRGDPEVFDFTLETDMGVFVWGDHDDSFPVYGPLSPPHSISLYPEWNLIGWSSLDRVDAATITLVNHNVQIIAKYNIMTQSYESYTVGDPSVFDFTLRDGEGYFVYSTGSTPADFFMGGDNYVIE